jgi:hypothetical protein
VTEPEALSQLENQVVDSRPRGLDESVDFLVVFIAEWNDIAKVFHANANVGPVVKLVAWVSAD